MQKYWQLIVGLLLLAAAFAPPGLVHNPPAQHVAKAPEDCRSSPLPRPIKQNSNAAVTGTVKQAENNKSIVHISFDVNTESAGQTLTINIPEGGNIVDSRGVVNTSDSEVRANLSRDSFWIRYSNGSPAVHNFSYTAGPTWIIAPTPETGDVDVTFEPAETGYIGQNILYLGGYTTQTKQVGCQQLRVIKPNAADINAERRLTMLASVARRFNIGKTYRTVTIFASPKKLGPDTGIFDLTSKGGFVWELENEIVVYDRGSIHDARNMWVHEYIHTRQFRPDDEQFEWIIEATATYYAARLSLELGYISAAEYNAQLAEYARFSPEQPLASATDDPVAYQWGAVVVARLDTALVRRGETSLFGIYQDMNSGAGPSLAGYEEFERRLTGPGGLNETRVNETRATVFDSEPPQPGPIYVGNWWERPLIADRSLPYVTPLMVLRWLAKVVGIVLTVSAGATILEDRFPRAFAWLRERTRWDGE